MSAADRKAEWLAARRRHITGTDVAKILGVTRFGSAMDVFLAKTDAAEESAEESEQMEWGNRLQTPILSAYADKTGEVVDAVDPYALFRSETLSVLAASLDGIVRSDGAPVDAKNIRWKDAGDWGDPGTDQIPAAYAAQLVVQMHVLRSRNPAAPPTHADLAVLFSGSSFASYRLHHDAEAEAAVLDAVDRFWRTYIVRGVPPPVDGTKAWAEYLARRVKQASEVIIEGVPEVDEWAVRLRAARATIAVAEAEEALAKNNLCALIGEGAGAKGPWGRISWKASKGGTTLDVDAYAAALEEIARAAGVPEEAIAEAKSKSKKSTPPRRTFRPTFNEEKKP